jgi:hypothetical protein
MTGIRPDRHPHLAGVGRNCLGIGDDVELVVAAGAGPLHA